MLKIEAGKFYRTRDGQKVGPMRPTPAEWELLAEWVWTDRDDDDGEMGDNLWRDDGTSGWPPKDDPRDLIAEASPSSEGRWVLPVIVGLLVIGALASGGGDDPVGKPVNPCKGEC